MKKRSAIVLCTMLMAIPFSTQAETEAGREESLYHHAVLIPDDKVSLEEKHLKKDHAPDHHDHHFCRHHKPHGDKMRHKGKAYSNRHDTSHGKSYRIKNGMMYEGGKNKIVPHEIF